jgi:hypothetical protein
MFWEIQEIADLKGYTIEWAEPGKYYLSRRNQIFSSDVLKPPFKKIAEVPSQLWRRVASNFRLAQRLLRFMITNIVDLGGDEVFITFDKTAGVIQKGNFKLLHGLVRPCRVLRSGCAVDQRGDVFFGEYLANAERGEIRIYRYTSGSDSVEIAYTFRPGSIRHVHGIYYDRFTGALLCLTGDADNECRIVRSFDGFQTIEIVGQGDESWRAVSVLFDAEKFYYGTDAEYDVNKIYGVNRNDLKRTAIGKVDGTVFYSKILGTDLLFATTAENAPSQEEDVASLWHVDGARNCERIVSFPKDLWPPSLFMFGTIHFPYRNMFENELFFSLVGVKGDNRTYCARKRC